MLSFLPDLPDMPWPAWVGMIATALFVLKLLWLWRTGAWSFRIATTLAALIVGSFGILVLPEAWSGTVAFVRAVRSLEVVKPWWLIGLIAVPLVWFVSRRSLSGLGPWRRRIAIGLRGFLVACLVLALAEPRIRRTSENVTTLFVIDRSFSVPPELDANRFGPDGEPLDARWDRIKQFVDASVRQRSPDHRHDQAGVILFGRRPKLILPPAAVDRLPVDERLAGPLDGQYTDVAAAIKLALASFPEGTGKRIVLISDGNENLGRAEEQAQLAKQQGVQIDVVPLASGYRNENEVLVQAVEAPAQTAKGVRLPVRVLIRNAHPHRIVEGSLELVQMRDREVRPVPIIDGPGVVEKPMVPGPVRVRLKPGLNVFRFRDRAEDPNANDEISFSYRATFLPVRSFDPDGGNMVAGLPGDRSANNRATTAVVARGQRRVLFLEEATGEKSAHKHLIDTLRGAKIRVDTLAASALPADKGDLGVFLSNYDCVMIADVPAESFATAEQMEAIRDAVSDQGCGLIMVGGPSSYGPGGYQRTAIEAALPVDCDIKSLKAVGRGGLVLVMHASEMADGNKWQKEVAKLAIERLSPADMVGVVYYTGAVSWFIPFQEVGDDKNRFFRRLDQMTPGDMPDFDPYLTAAVDVLTDGKYSLATRHVIVISDGDPSYGVIGQAAVGKMAAGGVICTTVGVATHGPAEDQRMKKIAEATRGNFYNVNDPTKLPAIYIKESRRVSQSFLYTDPFGPKLRIRGGPTAQLPDALPRLFGFVRTTLKPSAIAEMAIEGPKVEDQQFPVLAYWQFGAGRTAAFTSDARSQPGGVKGWDRDWIASDLYQKFWEQLVNWAMRTAETGRLVILPEYRDGKVRITVDARDDKDRPLAGITLRGKVTAPRPPQPGEKPPTIEFTRTGAGRYEAEFPADEAGSYFVSVQAVQNGEVTDGARIGVTVPYSPEFADVESNTPLLKRLADITGGKIYDESEAELAKTSKAGDVFRDALKTVRSLLPFWFWLVFAAGIGLFFDVAIRRVSVEPAEVKAWGLRRWRKLRTRSSASETRSESIDRLFRAKGSAAERIEREQAGRRFDPSSVPLSVEPPRVETGDIPPPPLLPPPPSATPQAADDFLSRMQRAKRRAQQDKPDDEPRT